MTAFRSISVAALSCLVAYVQSASAAPSKTWPDLTKPAGKVVGGGEQDAAVVIGIETYSFVAPVPGALENANSWYDYFTRTRGTRPENVLLLRDLDATAEGIRDATLKAADRVGAGGTLWFVFIGHGAPTSAGTGVLVGVDAQQKANSLQQRGIAQDAIADTLATSKAAHIVMLLDACFSGRTGSGQALVTGLQPLVVAETRSSLDKRATVITAAQSDQFAGPLLGASRPAFSYLVLGGLRGWADDNHDSFVTATEAHQYAARALKSTTRDREQVPTLSGDGATKLGRSSNESAPDIVEIVKANSSSANSGVFQVASLPNVETAKLPRQIKEERALDFSGLDIAKREAYDRVVVLDDDITRSPEDKAAAWKQFAKSQPAYAKAAEARAKQWTDYAEQTRKVAEINRMYAKAREADWNKLARLLRLVTVTNDEKKAWLTAFIDRYSFGWVGGVRNDVTDVLKPDLVQDLVVRYARQCAKADLQRCTDIGYFYFLGAGVPRDVDMAERLFLRSCRENGVQSACRGLYHVRDERGQVKLDDRPYIEASARLCLEGEAPLCNEIGVLLETSDRPLANFMYQRACDGGVATGCTNLATAYREGLSVARNLARSAELSALACEMGSAVGCMTAGYAYSTGEGVKRDQREAVRYSDMGCQMGDGNACWNLFAIYTADPKLSPSPEHTRRLKERACSLGQCENQK